MRERRFRMTAVTDPIGDYCAAFRKSIRLRRELSILSRSSGMGGDRERILGELAESMARMNESHESCVTMLRTRIPTW